MSTTGRDQLIYIDTPILSLTIKASSAGREYAANDREASCQIACDDSFNAELAGDSVLAYEHSSGRAQINEYHLYPVFFEQQSYELIIEGKDKRPLEFWHDNVNIRNSVSSVGRNSNLLTGMINFRNEIGYSDLVVKVNGFRYLKLTIEVFPSKLDYKEDYKAILADVTSEIYNLAFDFLKRTYQSYDTSNKHTSSPVEFFAIIRGIYEKFMSAADMVLTRPHHVLLTTHEIVNGNRIKRPDNKTIKWLSKHPEQLKRSDGTLKVSKAPAVQKRVSYDTPENRLTKYMLLNTVRRLQSFLKVYGTISRKADEAVIAQTAEMIRDIKRRYEAGVLGDVNAIASDSGMSLIFSMAPGYRELYKYYLLLKHGLSITGSMFDISIKNLALLYEYWCFIKLHSILKERYLLLSQDIIKADTRGLSVALIKGQDSTAKYRNPLNDEVITLRYNPKEINGPTVPQRPDNVLSLTKNGSNISYEYIFDAKYRIDPAEYGTTYQQSYATPGPVEEDINTMHRYRDAIVSRSKASPFERLMFGAYVLFPYRNEEEYTNHHFYKSIDRVNIGGIPFMPSATTLLTQLIDNLVAYSPETSFEGTSFPVGTSARLARVDWSKKDVLIGLVEAKENLQQIFEQRYYDTVVSLDRLPIYYVALYVQSEGITLYGKVTETHRLNKTFSDTASVSKSRLMRFEVENWLQLPHPIKAEAYGPGSIAYTNFFLLMNSTSYPQLFLRSEAEYRLFTELKRLTNNITISKDNDKIHFLLSNINIIISNNMIHMNDMEQNSVECTTEEFYMRPGLAFRNMLKRLKI